jgi:hypothetical protein
MLHGRIMPSFSLIILNELIVHKDLILNNVIIYYCPHAEAVGLEVAKASAGVDSAETDGVLMLRSDGGIILIAAEE